MKLRVITGMILLCFSVLFAFPTNTSPGSYYEMPLTVSARATTVPAGTPIVTKVSVLNASIPAGVDIDWDSIYVLRKGVAVPHQIDDLDEITGVSGNDELVFQAVEGIASDASDNYTVWFATKDEGFPSATYPVEAWTDYTANYSATDVAAAGNRTDVATWGAKPAYFLKNDLITISIPLQSDWRQGSVFDAIINATGFDVQHQLPYAQKPSGMEWSWRWSGFMYEADPGWVNTPTNFTLVKQIIQGPVRSMLVINSTAPYKDGGLKPGVHELKTVTIYKDMPAVYSDIQLTGANATEDYSFTYAVKFLDWCEANLYDTIYAPGVGIKTRYNYTLGAGVPGVLWNPEIGETNMTAWWYQMYNATSKQGYGVCFSPEDLQKIDWSPGELDIWYEDIDAPPAVARRSLVLFDPSVTTNSTDLMVDMYDMWSAEPTVTVTTAEETTLLPGWKEWIFNAGTWDETTYYVRTFSNSTVSGFNFNPDEKLMSFNVTGSSGTAGFCNVTIPKDILWGVYTVYVGDTEVDYTPTDNSTHAFLYFTYNHTGHNVRIYGTEAIPEFLTWTSILLILIVLTVATAINKRRLNKTPIIHREDSEL